MEDIKNVNIMRLNIKYNNINLAHLPFYERVYRIMKPLADLDNPECKKKISCVLNAIGAINMKENKNEAADKHYRESKKYLPEGNPEATKALGDLLLKVEDK